MALPALRGASAHGLQRLGLAPSARPCAWHHHHCDATATARKLMHGLAQTSSSSASSSSASTSGGSFPHFSFITQKPAHTASPSFSQGPSPKSLASSSSSSSFASSGLPPQSDPEHYYDIPPVVLSPQPCRVVVIGWMGSRARYVRKYTSLWERTENHAVLTIRPTIAQTLIRFKGVVQAGADIDKVARLQMENPTMPTFYHIFSTGGFTHAGTMWRWMDEVEDQAMRQGLLEEVAGIILDSAPSNVTEQVAARAVVSAISGIPADQVQDKMSALMGPTEAFFRFWLNTKGIKLRREEVFDAWFYRAPVCPQLYLYSDVDPLVDPAYVEEYMKVQESRGVDVTSYRFSGSGHCEHFRLYPHEYALQVSQFVSKALAKW